MIKTLLIAYFTMNGIFHLQEMKAQESIMIKHQSKIIENGYFVFCDIVEDKEVAETTFGYTLDLKKQKFAISLVGSDTTSLDLKSKAYFRGFCTSEDWNRKRDGSSVEKYFLIFHPDFLTWNNSEKIDFLFKEAKLNN